LGKAKSFRSRINLGIFDLPTDYRYFITKIVDGLGMITEYAQDFDADSVIIHVHDRYVIYIVFDILFIGRPEASLVCDANKPLEVLTMDNGAIDPSFLSKTVIPVSIVGKCPPFDLNYSITTPGGLIMERKMSSLIGNRVEIPVSEMGVYALGAVSDGKCSGIVSRQTCKVAPFVEPSVSVHSSLIETPCFGQIGFSFNLQFTGNFP
jgi:hypothetical protein